MVVTAQRITKNVERSVFSGPQGQMDRFFITPCVAHAGSSELKIEFANLSTVKSKKTCDVNDRESGSIGRQFMKNIRVAVAQSMLPAVPKLPCRVPICRTLALASASE